MKKWQRNICWLLLVGGLVLGFWLPTHMTPAIPDKYVAQRIPTFFFHGWGGSYRSEEQMTHAIQHAGVTQTIIRADVTTHGQVRLRQRLPRTARNPLIEVNFLDNRHADYQLTSRWAAKVFQTVQQQYPFHKFNVVAHSMGNMTFMYYLVNHAAVQSAPHLNKQVALAGHFNGILGYDDRPNRMQLNAAGRPQPMNPEYRPLLPLRQTYPRSAAVLNIYGDRHDGTHSDGAVSNASSQSLRYLVRSRARSYREQKIVGTRAQHSQLHENSQVDRLLINFLWHK